MESSILEYPSQKTTEESVLARYNVNIIDISPVIDTSYNKYYRYIAEFDLTNAKKKDLERVFMNFFIIEVCETLKKVKGHQSNILFYNRKHIYNDKKVNFYKIILKSLKNLPILHIIWDDYAEFFIKSVASSDITAISSIDIAKNQKRPDLSKLRMFLKRNDLCYLYNTYFKQATNKIIAFR